MFRIYIKSREEYIEYQEKYSEDIHENICKSLNAEIDDTEIIFPLDVLQYPSCNVPFRGRKLGVLCVNFDRLPFANFKPIISKENGHGGMRVYNIPERYFFNLDKVFDYIPKFVKVMTDRTCSMY